MKNNFREVHERLSELLPQEFLNGSYDETEAFQYRDSFVKYEVDGTKIRWLGKQKYVFFWMVLEENIAVGFNENPSLGWSFPVVKLKEGDVFYE